MKNWTKTQSRSRRYTECSIEDLLREVTESWDLSKLPRSEQSEEKLSKMKREHIRNSLQRQLKKMVVAVKKGWMS